MKKQGFKKEPTWEFQDQTYPARVLYLLAKEELTGTDLLLLAVIDKLVVHQAHLDGIGCYAKNEFLAESVGVHPTYVSQRLSYLEGKGLVLIVRLLGKRYLECEWSRTAEERVALKGAYGKACRKAHHDLVKRIEGEGKALGKPKGANETSGPPLGIPKTAPLGKDKGPSLYSNEIDSSPPSPPKGERVRGFMEEQEGGVPLKSEAHQLAELLYRKLAEKNVFEGRSKPKLPSWAREFKLALEARSFEFLKELIEDHVEHLFKDDYQPQCFCAHSFVEKRLKIEKARERRKRMRGDDREESPLPQTSTRSDGKRIVQIDTEE